MSRAEEVIHEFRQEHADYGQPVPANPLYVDRNRTRVTIDFEGLLTLRDVYERLASLETLTDNLVIIDYRKTEDYC
jgi:ribosomal protein S24E